jgi:hypothetical protein
MNVETTTFNDPTRTGNDGDGLSQAGSHAQELGRRAARTITDMADTVAQRVRERDLSGALSDVRRIVQEKPGAALLTAVVIGFVLARSLSRH